MGKTNFYETENGTTFTLEVNLKHETGATEMTKTERGYFLFDSVRMDVNTIGKHLCEVGQGLTMEAIEGRDVGPMIEMLGRNLCGLS